MPDETTVCKFRHLLEEHELGGEMLETVNLHLARQRGADHDRDDRRRDHHSCAQFDQEPGAEARPGDAPDEEGQAVVLRDEGARGRGQQDEADSHGGGDGGQRRRLPRCCRSCCTGKRRKVWGDQAYRGQSEVIRASAPQAQDCTQRRYRYKNRVDEVERAKNRTKSQVRSKVEHVFGVMKLKFGFAKVRYRGLAKNANRLFATCALVNLYVVRKRLVPAAA